MSRLKQLQLKGKMILVVDDEADLREVISIQLESYGATTVLASNGVEALKILQQNSKIDLVLSDTRMPGPNGDGLTLLRNLMALPGKHPPFLFMTGFSEFDHTAARKLGAHAVLTKPFVPEDLEAAIINALQLEKLAA